MALFPERSELRGSTVESSPKKNNINKKQNKKKSNDKMKNNNNKSNTRRGRPRKNSSGDLSVDSCSTASLSDSSTDSRHGSPAPQQRRRNRNRNNKSNNKKQQQQQPELTDAEKQRYVAMDCEMVGVGENGCQSALARVTLVGWDGQVVLDEYIRPDREITDYRTFVSGISSEDLNNATLDLTGCRKLVLEHLAGKILVGHALKNDLHALGIRHPWQYTRDTAKYEPFMKVRFDDGILWPRKLRDLVTEKLSRKIQKEGVPHSPYEDALAALDLYKKVRTKWEKVMDYKIKKTAEIEQQKQQKQQQQQSLMPTVGCAA